MNNTTQFINAINQSGITPPSHIVDDGEIHRFSSNGKTGNKDGWYIYYCDGIAAGSFGCFRSDISQSWRSDVRRNLSEAEHRAQAERIKVMQSQREKEIIKNQADAKINANSIWKKSEAVTEHIYLTNKGVKPYAIKQSGDALVIPLRADGEIHSLQYINADGSKRFLYGGRIKGCYFSIGKPQGIIYICEGYATGASIYEATGDAVAIAFNAGNLSSVAEAIKAKYPDDKLVVCADDDPSDIGIKKANLAAKLVGASVVKPHFGDIRPDKATDFNDLHKLNGLQSVAEQLGAIQAPLSDINKVAEVNVLPSLNVVAHRLQNAPESLPSLPDVMPFDYAYLPDGLRGYVMDISNRMQCPPDYAAVGVMVMMAAIIGRQVAIRPKRKDNWTVIPNLWGAVVGNSGVMKSPTLSAALSPISKLAKEATEAFNLMQSEYDAQAMLMKIQQSISKDEAKKVLSKDRSADVANLLKPTAIGEPPIHRRYKTNNATYEALGELMRENPNGLLVEADEIIGLLKKLDAGGQEEARAFYLTAADGDKGYTFDRIMRGKGLHIDALCISIIGGIQPGVLAEYVRQATSGGAGTDGLLQRFGLMVYPDVSPKWKDVDQYPDSEARNHVNALAERLDNINIQKIGAITDDYCNVPYLHFDDEAQTLFTEWREELELRLRSGEEHEAIVSHLSKYRKLVPTLALINHLCDSSHGAVSEKALLRAIAFGEYLESHARRIYSYATRPDIDAAKTVLKKIRGGKLPNPFKARDVYRSGWAGLESPAKVQTAIDLLLEYSHISLEELITGGRPTTYYHLNKGAAL